MGYAIAEAARHAGHHVTLISGPAMIEPPSDVDLVPIVTSDELHDAVHDYVRDCDVLVMCAAVCDYKPVSVAQQKTEKRAGAFALELIPTRDILASLPSENRSYLVVGFAAQTHDLEQNALRKLHAKNCDMIVANDVSGTEVGMDSDDNAVTIFFKNGQRKMISRAPKIMIAHELMKIISLLHQNSLTKNFE